MDRGGGSKYETLCTVVDRGGEVYVHMCTGMTNAMFYGNGDTDVDRYGTG